MRILLAIIVAAALGWTGWWFAIAKAKEAALSGWLAERRAAGWQAEATEVSVGGFPYRIDTTVTDLALANPEAGWAWTAPEFQFLTLAYQPNSLIAIWPREQSVATPLGTTRVTSEQMMGSVTVEPNRRLALDRSVIEIAGLTLADAAGAWQIGIDTAQLSTRQAEGEDAPPFAHDIAFGASGLRLPEGWTAGLDRSGLLAPAIDRADLDLLAVFDQPWDRPAIEGEPPALEALEIRDATFTWGSLDLRARGRIEADARGFAEGEIDLRARNWQEMIAVAETSGALSSGVASALRAGLGILARLAGDGTSLQVPLEFDDGRTRLGPVPLGPAPRMVRR
jgi:hypothetical protein